MSRNLEPGGFTSEGIWLSSFSNAVRNSRRCLFLDRDGVLVEDVGYLRRAEDVRILPGVFDLLRWATMRDLAVVVVTNQSGIARGFFDWSAYCEVENEIARQLYGQGLAVDLTVACPFHPDFTPYYGETHAYWRKPGPGMLCLAADRMGLNLAESWIIGDKASDVGAAQAAGISGAIYLSSNDGGKQPLLDFSEVFDVLVAKDIADANRILARWLP